MPTDEELEQQEREQSSAHPEGWPGIKGRSRGHEADLETGTPRDQQASVTDAQRRLEEPSPDEK